MRRLADFVLGRPQSVLGLAALFSVVSLIGLRGLRFDFSPQVVFSGDKAVLEDLTIFREAFGGTDNFLMYLVRAPAPGGLFTPEGLRYIDAIAEVAAEGEAVESVQSLVGASIVEAASDPDSLDMAVAELVPELPESPEAARQIGERALASPLLAGRLVSKAGDLTLVVLRFPDDMNRVDELDPHVSAVTAAVSAVPAPPGFTVAPSGLPHIRTQIVGRLIADQRRFVPLITLCFVAVLLLLFRRAWLVVLPPVSVGLVLLGLGGFLGAADIPLNLVSNILPALLFVVGISDAIHLVTRYQQELAAGVTHRAALHRAVAALGAACALTSLTTAAGFGSLSAASNEALSEFGLMAAGGVLLAWIVTVIVMPAALVGRSPQARPVHEGRRSFAAIDAFLRGCCELSLRHPKALCAAFAVVIAASAVFAVNVRVDNRLMGNFDEGDPTAESYRAVEAELLGVMPLEIDIETGEAGGALDPAVLARVAEVQAAVAALPGIASHQSILDPLYALRSAMYAGDPQARRIPETRQEAAQLLLLAEMGDGDALTASLLDEDQSRTRVSARTRDVGGGAFSDNLERLDGQLTEILGPSGENLTWRLTGEAFYAYAGITGVITDLFKSLLLALVIIALAMLLLFRSPALAALSIFPNAFPLLLTGGVMGLAGLQLEITTVVVFTLGLGLAVDDTIHFLHRFEAERPLAASIDEALRRTFDGTGRAILFTSLLLVLGLGVVVFSDFRPNRKFAILICVAMSSAVFGDLLLLPALLKLSAPWLRRRPS